MAKPLREQFEDRLAQYQKTGEKPSPRGKTGRIASIKEPGRMILDTPPPQRKTEDQPEHTVTGPESVLPPVESPVETSDRPAEGKGYDAQRADAPAALGKWDAKTLGPMPEEIRQQIVTAIPKALARLTALLDEPTPKGRSTPMSVVSAAEQLLDRALGRAPQTVQITDERREREVLASLSDEELRIYQAVLERMAGGGAGLSKPPDQPRQTPDTARPADGELH